MGHKNQPLPEMVDLRVLLFLFSLLLFATVLFHDAD